jgi:hypothetical protein
VSAPEPLSEQRRAKIERQARFHLSPSAPYGPDSASNLADHIVELLAEVDRLRATTERQALLDEIHEAVLDVWEVPMVWPPEAGRALARLGAALAAADPVRLPKPELAGAVREALGQAACSAEATPCGGTPDDCWHHLSPDDGRCYRLVATESVARRALGYEPSPRLPEKGEPADG